MLPIRALHRSICASCRLRNSIAVKQLARSRKRPLNHISWRQFGLTRRLQQQHDEQLEKRVLLDLPGDQNATLSPEEAALQARNTFGDALPSGYLSEEAYKVYERLYGKPLDYRHRSNLVEEEAKDALEAEDVGTGVLKEVGPGILEEVEFDEQEVMQAEYDQVNPPEEELLDYHDQENVDWHDEDMETVDREQQDGDERYQRTHPLTLLNRFGTSPLTLPLPKHSLVDAIQSQISGISNKHLKEAAHRVFGGVGLPYSTSTPAIGKTLQQKPIALDASQSKMSEIEGDVFLAALIPGMYASIMSVLVETRKRLGSSWAENLVEKAKKNELRILDAGGGGAGVLAVRELLRAEWERMHEESGSLDSGMALAQADGKIGGAGAYPPMGHATALAASDVLRKRASRLLENTTFVPRLPDYLHANEAAKKGKFDIIIAPHTLWPLREDHLRKTHMQNLWDLVSQDGGVMLLLEKGVPRGFELVAAAREMLLETKFASSSWASGDAEINGKYDSEEQQSPHSSLKEKAMIIAPCTNHESCPMYQPQGMVKGRRDICHFSQRYVRPAFQQTILGAKDKNFEDVKFSYLSVMRGRDMREEWHIEQPGELATDEAFEGYDDVVEHKGPRYMESISPLLPRAVLPPIKRKGHVILDLCTPSGALERWTVPKSFSKQAFRDARKSSWGDLWALGAKTRVPRIPKIKKRKSNADMDVEGKVKSADRFAWDADVFEKIVPAGQNTEQPAAKGEGGRMRNGRKVKGIRDKRDKKLSGNGRKKHSEED